MYHSISWNILNDLECLSEKQVKYFRTFLNGISNHYSIENILVYTTLINFCEILENDQEINNEFKFNFKKDQQTCFTNGEEYKIIIQMVLIILQNLYPKQIVINEKEENSKLWEEAIFIMKEFGFKWNGFGIKKEIHKDLENTENEFRLKKKQKC